MTVFLILIAKTDPRDFETKTHKIHVYIYHEAIPLCLCYRGCRVRRSDVMSSTGCGEVWTYCLWMSPSDSKTENVPITELNPCRLADDMVVKTIITIPK